MKYSKKELKRILIDISKTIPDKYYREKYFPSALDRYVDILDNVNAISSSGAVVLDAGCGYGDISVALSKLGYNVKALDLFNDNVITISNNDSKIQFKRHNIEASPLPFETEYFDVVVFTEILEHINYSPVFPLSEIYRVLKKNGKLILATPNIARLKSILMLLMERNVLMELEDFYINPKNVLIENGRSYIDRHVRIYTTREVKELLVRVGFRINKLRYSYNPGCGNQNVIMKLLHMILRTMLCLTNNRLLGDFILVVAEK